MHIISQPVTIMNHLNGKISTATECEHNEKIIGIAHLHIQLYSTILYSVVINLDEAL